MSGPLMDNLKNIDCPTIFLLPDNLTGPSNLFESDIRVQMDKLIIHECVERVTCRRCQEQRVLGKKTDSVSCHRKKTSSEHLTISKPTPHA